MYCPNCGTKNNYYHRYCFLCGTCLVTDEQQPQGEHENPENELESFQDFFNTDLDEGEGTKKIDEDTFFSNLGSAAFDFSYDDTDESKTADDPFDLQETLPLRRYKKAASKKGHGAQKLLKASLVIMLCVLTCLLIYVGYTELWGRKGQPPVSNSLDLTYDIEDIIQDGENGKKITFYSTKGSRIIVTGDLEQDLSYELPVVNGKAELILLSTDFLSQDHDIVDGHFNITLNIKVRSDGYKDRFDKITLKMPVAYAPLTMIQPADSEAVVDAYNYKLIIKVKPGSEVFIDDNSYSHMVDEDGNLTVPLEVPDLPELTYTLRVVYPGYADNEKTITLKRRQMEIPLAIYQTIPITSAEEWVEITGTTDPQAVLSSSLPTREEPAVDPDTGNFVLHVRATRSGYTPLVLTARVEGKEDSVLELVIDRTVDEATYTRSAWAPEYERLKGNENLHNGQSFVFTGVIKKLDSTGTKNILIVNTGTDSNEKLIHVEFFGTHSFTVGQKVRVFGNRWGNKDGIPYILAKYLYRSN